MGVLLAVGNDRLVPSPHRLDESTVLRLGGVELLEAVALPVGGDVEDGLVLLATDNESTLDNRVVVLAVDGGAAKDVLARSLEAGVEAANEVVGHKSQGELLVVLVVDLPEGPLLEVNVLPEPLHGLRGLVVGEVALPLIKSHSRLAKRLARVLGLGSILSRGGGCGGSSGGRSTSGLRSLLGGDVGQLGLLDELELASDGGPDGLVDDGLEPASDGRVLLAPLLVVEELEAAGDDTGAEKIGKGNALANEVGVVHEVLLNSIDGLLGKLGRVVNGLLVVVGAAKEG